MKSREPAHVVVVGAGVVGLAVARVLAQIHRDVLILEAQRSFGMGSSARGSAVIHAGLYYPQDSLKARTCLRGRELLYRYAAERGIGVRKTGKLIVACSSDELHDLERLRAQAQANGVEDLVALSQQGARDLEPALATVRGALLSPSTGIIDCGALMQALLEDAQAHGARALFATRVMSAQVTSTGFTVTVDGAESRHLRCRVLVNCAGLGSVGLAENIAGLERRSVPHAYLCKGSYFALAGHVPFQHLIYPLPEPGGLGVHLTFDLAGAARFGPDVQWVDEIDNEVDPSRAALFERAILRYWPGLPRQALQPAHAGIRSKIVREGEPPADFRIDGEREHGVRGLVNLFGIESPGLTAALSLAETVASRVSEG
jgi:L-2-hydroxyglutarate oxidase LhgO